MGEKRCGTTSLHRYLTQHPDVLRPFAPKSTHYFDTKFDRPFEWYERHFWPEVLVKRMESGGPKKITGESSPYYFFHPTAAERIAAALPEARLLVLLREPGARAWSNHQYEVAKGNETLSFDEAIIEEDSRVEGEEARLIADPHYVSDAHRTFSYVGRGRYHAHLQRLYRSFDPSAVHVIRSEDLYRRPQQTMAGVHAFLGLREVAVEDTTAGRANQPSERPAASLDAVRERLTADTHALSDLLGQELWPR